MSNKNAKSKSDDKNQLYVNKSESKSDCKVNAKNEQNAVNSTGSKCKNSKDSK